jgi:hypothetical protein
MSLGLVEKIRRNLGVRLGLWSALIFALSSAALLALAYYLLAAAVGSKDREVLQARVREFAAVYDTDGLSGLRRVVHLEEGNQKTFFVRLVSPWNDVAFVSVPDEWVTFHDIPTGMEGYRRQVGSSAFPKMRSGILCSPRRFCRTIRCCKWAAAATAANRCWSRCGAVSSWWAG